LDHITYKSVMKLHFLLLGFIFLSYQSSAQKVKIKDNIVSIDGEHYMQWEKGPMGMDATIKPIGSNVQEIFMTYQDYIDRNEITKSNPEGKVRWIELNFLTSGLKCEVSSRTHKALAKLIYDNEIYINDELDLENVQRFVKKYGNKFSENRAAQNGNINIIINN
jgi:hypothetical protein